MQDVALRADAGIDDGDVHGAGRKILVRTADPEAGFGRPLRRNVVRQVDDARVRKAAQDHAFHDGRKRTLVAEIGRDRDDA